MSACLQNPDPESPLSGLGLCWHSPFNAPSGTPLHRPGHARPLMSAQLVLPVLAAEVAAGNVWSLGPGHTHCSICIFPSPGSDSSNGRGSYKTLAFRFPQTPAHEPGCSRKGSVAWKPTPRPRCITQGWARTVTLAWRSARGCSKARVSK